MKLSIINKFFLSLTLFITIVAPSHAQPIGEAAGFLKRADNRTAELTIQQALIEQITVTNVIKNKMSSTAEMNNTVNVTPLSMPSPAPAMAPRAALRRGKASSTNLREQGVDEADLVKTDGRYLYALSNNDKSRVLRIYDTQFKSKQLRQVSQLPFGKYMHLKGIYLLASQNKLVVIADNYRQKVRKKGSSWGGTTNLFFIDIRNKARPIISRQVQLEGSTRNSRRIGNQLYMVMNSYSFRLPPTYKTVSSTKPISLQRYQNEKQRLVNIIKAWRIQQQLPHYRDSKKKGVHSLINSGNFYLNVEDVRSFALTTIVAIDLNSSQFSFNGIAYFGSPNTVYASTKALYLTRSLYDHNNHYRLDQNLFPKDNSKTLIHKFAFKGRGFDYRGSGVVLGNLGWNEMSTFQLDEDAKGNLRVVSYNRSAQNKKYHTNDPATRSPVILTALAEQAGKKQLITSSRLPNRYYPESLGKNNEQLYGARLFDDYAYLVTFRRTDPLYVIDMRNPRSMKIAGKLIIPGFSDYLHPIDNGLLLGIGKEVEVGKDGKGGQVKGVKLSLFDIRNPHQPRELHKIVIGDRDSNTPVSQDYHALTTLKLDQSNITRVLLPVSMREDKKTYNHQSSLQRFEVDSRNRTIRHLGSIKAKKGKQRWYWSNDDRSIIIGDRIFYYHNGQFQETPWNAHTQKVVN